MFFGKNIIYLLTLWATLSIIFAEESSGQNDAGSGPPNGPPQNDEEEPNKLNGHYNEKASMFDQIPFFGPLASQFASSLPNFPNFLGQGFSGGFGQNGLGFRPSSTSQNGEALQPPNIIGQNAFDGPNENNRDGGSGFGQLPFFGPMANQYSSSFSNPMAQGPSGFGIGGVGDTRESEADAPEDEPSEDQSEEDGNHGRLFFSTLFNTRLVTCNYTTQAGRTCSSCRQALRCFPSNVGTLRTCRGFFPYCNNGRCSIFQGSQCNSAATTTVATTSATESTTTTG